MFLLVISFFDYNYKFNKKEIKKLNSLPIRQSVIQTRTEPHLNQSIDNKYTHT